MMTTTVLIALCFAAAAAIPAPVMRGDWGDTDCGGSIYPDAGRNPNPKSKIVNGWESRVHEFPFQVALYFDWFYICGGSIIDSTHVLSAAHCMFSESPSDYLIRVGAQNLDGGTEHDAYYTVENIARHPLYGATTGNDHDIVVLTTFPIAYSDGRGSVCSPVKMPDYYAGKGNAVVIGWGATASGGANSPDLRVVDVPVMTFDDCQRAFDYSGIVDSMLCAGWIGDNPKDACQGDSGGPLVFKNNGRFDLVGIVSWGRGCASNYPGVYMDVNYVHDWIHEQSRSN